jgi:hypothetical protein
MTGNQLILFFDITDSNQVLPQGQRRVEGRRQGSLDEFLRGVGFIIQSLESPQPNQTENTQADKKQERQNDDPKKDCRILGGVVGNHS